MTVPLITNASYPLLDVFWTLLWFFLWILWIFLLIRIVGDLFRSPDLGGGTKAAWLILLIIFPLIGVLAYLIVRGGRMHERELRRAAAAEDSFRSYVQSAAGTSSSTAEEIGKLADLRDRGILTEEEYQAEKARVLAH